MRAGWYKEHSLSLALFAGYVVSAAISACMERGTWSYDFWMMNAGCFGGGAIIVVLGRYLWERDSDPAKPPT